MSFWKEIDRGGETTQGDLQLGRACIVKTTTIQVVAPGRAQQQDGITSCTSVHCEYINFGLHVGEGEKKTTLHFYTLDADTLGLCYSFFYTTSFPLIQLSP